MEEPDLPYPVEKNNSKLKWFLLLCLVGIGILGSLYVYRKPQKIEAKRITITPVQYKQLSNSPTKPVKNKKNVTIQVLNGTGIQGQASKIVKALEEAGYTLNNIKSGNAKTIGGATTSITSRADFEEIVIHIKEVLKPLFPEITDGISNHNPNEDSGFDVVIITGSTSTSPRPLISPTENP